MEDCPPTDVVFQAIAEDIDGDIVFFRHHVHDAVTSRWVEMNSDSEQTPVSVDLCHILELREPLLLINELISFIGISSEGM